MAKCGSMSIIACSGQLLLRRLLQQLDEVVFPDGGVGVGTVAVGLHRRRNQDEAGCGIRVTSFWAMSSSGGLMKSSAELIQRTGAVMEPSFGSGL